MLRPSYNEILEKVNNGMPNGTVNSKYSIVIAIAKRAREIIFDNENPAEKIIKPVSNSINDIYSQRTIIKKKIG